MAFLGSDPKDDRVIADNDASASDAGLGIMLYELFLAELAAGFERSFDAVRSVSLLTFNLVILGEVLYAAELTLFMITGEGPRRG